jgi:hypothetical protein
MRPKSRSWKQERASVTEKGKSRPRSNKYSSADSKTKPEAGSRQRIGQRSAGGNFAMNM